MKRPTQKFQRNDLVRISKDADWMAGLTGVVVGSYYEQYGGGKRERTIYTICFPQQGECSWFDGIDMTLIEEGRNDLMEQWRSKRTRRG